ncbi:MAG: acylphosphatase [Sphingomonadales bacterium]
MPNSKAIKVRIIGQVQGVFFRVWVKEKADNLGVMGWIRNRLDGDVEGLFVGPEEAVDALVEVCREGPKPALIDEIKIEPAQGVVPANFQIKPTV